MFGVQYLRAIGVGAPVNCCDVYGFDDELLAFLPRPVYAILFVFPDYRKFDQLYRHVYENMLKQGATVSHAFHLNTLPCRCQRGCSS
jgi:hypothetical protein